MTSPVAFPPLWDLASITRFHYDDNTNASLQRNMGQAIGVGALFATAKGHPEQVTGTTLKVAEIESLEQIVRTIKPPPSPFQAADKSELAAGERLYKTNCAGCHEAPFPEAPPAGAVGTDELRLSNFAKVVDGMSVTETLGRFLGAVEKVSKPHNPDKDPNWGSKGSYGLRGLRGVWATAPYLHNNSVPTLADLLTRPEDRPKKFVTDYSRYDAERVGFMTLPQATQTAPEFDTGEKGNGNQGHSYGVELSPPDKKALLSFLRQL
jgi:hypothetical protein